MLANKCLALTLHLLSKFSCGNILWCQSLVNNALTIPVAMSLVMTSSRLLQRIPSGGEDTELIDLEKGSYDADVFFSSVGLLLNLVQAHDAAKDHIRAIG